MKLNELLLAELEREGERSRKALEQVPDGKHDWKPHERSMIFGYLATMVATIPSWVAMMVSKDDLDLKPPAGSGFRVEPMHTAAEFLKGHEKAMSDARAALQATTDDHLMKPWQLKVAGNVVQEAPRYVMIGDTLNHLAHHRGQMTVYLRLMGAKVPALFGPSADDQQF